jgi:hypothetical protein
MDQSTNLGISVPLRRIEAREQRMRLAGDSHGSNKQSDRVVLTDDKRGIAIGVTSLPLGSAGYLPCPGAAGN